LPFATIAAIQIKMEKNRLSDHISAAPHSQFFIDVIKGLRLQRKRLNSKYFYDSEGDRLFHEIMNSPEYYLTNCEMEIFTEQADAISALLMQVGSAFDLIELGAGDASKTVHLLENLLKKEAAFRYLPIDISPNIIASLEKELPNQLPKLDFKGFEGEYFNMLEKACMDSDRRKVVLFLGSNIGNMTTTAAKEFCKELRSYLSRGDIAIIGFDLKKNPHTILAAYNDSAGFTRDFNLNLLTRINRELQADFILEKFRHYPHYDPRSGACKSYLISVEEQVVRIGNEKIHFAMNEYISMEISQKYTFRKIEELALYCGFSPHHNFFDDKKWFVDTAWII